MDIPLFFHEIALYVDIILLLTYMWGLPQLAAASGSPCRVLPKGVAPYASLGDIGALRVDVLKPPVGIFCFLHRAYVASRCT